MGRLTETPGNRRYRFDATALELAQAVFDLADRPENEQEKPDDELPEPV